MENKEVITPKEYFDGVKDKVHEMNDPKITELYNNCMQLVMKYNTTGQERALNKLRFHLESLLKEKYIISCGINKFVYKDDIEYYIEKVADKAVKIIELQNYEREIPDEIVEKLLKVKDKFDVFYIVFTDYTGGSAKEVKKYRRDKDPILFGTIQNKELSEIIDRFYYIGDWVDEYCDLTLAKMVAETKRATGENIEMKIKMPKDLKELQEQLVNLEFSKDNKFKQTNKNRSIINRFKSWMTK